MTVNLWIKSLGRKPLILVALLVAHAFKRRPVFENNSTIKTEGSKTTRIAI